jgi:hypothetical protein
LRRGEITQGGERNFIISGMKGRGLATETGEKMIRKAKMNYNRLAIAF